MSKPHAWIFFPPATVQCYLNVAAWKTHLVPLYRETTIQINLSSQILQLSSVIACIVNGEGAGTVERQKMRGRSLPPYISFLPPPQQFNACYAGYLFCHFKYSYKEVLWQVSWTFTGWHYEMSGISNVLVLQLNKTPTISYLIFEAASRNKPWSNSIPRSKAPSVISPEISL